MGEAYKKLTQCRLSKSPNLVSVLNLGSQALTGVFPTTADSPVSIGPIELVWCPDSGLLQLGHSFEPTEMYGQNYGYRSGLNQSMVAHLTNKVHQLERVYCPGPGDVVLDIGSNDGTTLKAYKTKGIQRIGIDPTGSKFRSLYMEDIKLVADFFSESAYKRIENKKAKIVTSIAMFYDLEDPIEFASQVEAVLDDDGVWYIEQSYLPSMLRMNSYDTICHEHLEYYSLTVIQKVLDAAGFKTIDVNMNSINGGSFAVHAVKRGNRSFSQNRAVIDWVIEQESRMGLYTPRPYREFEERVFRHREDLRRLIGALTAVRKKILGYGASTKGNVLLQFCGFSTSDIVAIAEVNSDKFGRVTPGTHIPIVPESEARAMRPDYFFVLPWHFKESILRREQDYISQGGKFIFPFPEIEIA